MIFLLLSASGCRKRKEGREEKGKGSEDRRRGEEERGDPRSEQERNSQLEGELSPPESGLPSYDC